MKSVQTWVWVNLGSAKVMCDLLSDINDYHEQIQIERINIMDSIFLKHLKTGNKSWSCHHLSSVTHLSASIISIIGVLISAESIILPKLLWRTCNLLWNSVENLTTQCYHNQSKGWQEHLTTIVWWRRKHFTRFMIPVLLDTFLHQ